MNIAAEIYAADCGLPGIELLQNGLRDLAAGQLTVEALLVAIGRRRLGRVGVVLPELALQVMQPEHQLYDLLTAQSSRNAHSRYNAFLRRWISLERALEHAARRSKAE